MSLITFIVNPTSGTGRSKQIPAMIHAYFYKTDQLYRIRYTEYAGHAKTIVNEEIAYGAQIIVAVGGDGTINEVGSTLLHSEVALGIIPTGSGNGLARHLNIPMHPRKALQVIAEGNTSTIDTGKVNHYTFFCTAGIGFDATVAQRFSQIKGRGFWNYIKASLSEYRKYVPEKVSDSNSNNYTGFLLTFCNANQYGNNAFICPEANIQDGKLNLVQVSPMPVYTLPSFIRQLFGKKLKNNTHYIQSTFSTLSLQREQAGSLHIDGDPVEVVQELTVRCIPKSLKVIVPLISQK